MSELNYFSLGSSICFFEVTLQGLRAVLFLTLFKSKLNSTIAVTLLCLELRNNAGTGEHNCAGNKLPVSAKNAGHPNLLSNDSGHDTLYFSQRFEVIPFKHSLVIH